MNWRPINSEPIDHVRLETLKKNLSLSEPFLRVLIRRGLSDPREIERFLHPEMEPLPSPGLLFDIEKAVERIHRAVREREKICIYGDYDVDGVCATTILFRTLSELGAFVSYEIPERQTEGYGMHEGNVQRLADQGVQLIITVDNGISAHKEIDLCNSLGIDVVVTDHHQCHETLPNAYAVVCATREGQDERIRHICGGVVAMLLATALGQREDRFLAIAALATVADIMPLTGFNRTIVAKGIPLIDSEPGLCALLEAAGAAGQPVNTQTLSFILSPHINAAGRMGDASRAVELLISADYNVRRHYAQELEAANSERKSEEQRIIQETEKQIPSREKHLLLMLRGEDWNPGVIGIVASRILNQYHCPVLLFTRVGEELVGSGRSVPGVDLFGLLSDHASFFTRFGGHTQAAGCAMKSCDFERCRKELTEDLHRRYPQGLEPETEEYEEQIEIKDCTVPFARELQMLAPFGEGNPEPQFLIKGTLEELNAVGKDGAHLSAVISDDNTRLKLIAFRFGDRYKEWKRLETVEVLCRLKENVFRGFSSVNGQVTALRAWIPENLRIAAEAFWKSPDPVYARRIADASVKRPDEARMRQLFVRTRECLKAGLLICDLDEELLLTMLVLYEAGIVYPVDERLFERKIEEKKQIASGVLYSVMHR
ncbi:MAG: single-stranded-DNA-specific exonuclease RecJ [Clostridia bacterium]|nr:single-stranded-DNA-specific exonuclease RecJ [Clostridia bacterium]